MTLGFQRFRVPLICVLLSEVFALAFPSQTGHAQTASTYDIGRIERGQIKPEVIAVPQVEALAGSSPIPNAGVIVETIYRNLEISGVFARPSNPQFVAEQRRHDREAGKIDYAEWRRLGANYLAVGRIAADGDRLRAEVELFGIDDSLRIFGNEYKDFKASSPRMLGRRVADDIVVKVRGGKGLALTQIAYVSASGRNAKEIWVMCADGEDKRQVTHDGSLVVAPCWGENGTELYFTSYRDRNPDLCGARVDGSQSWYISRYPGLNVSPSWSPGTKRIALTMGKDGNSEIYTMDRLGKNPRRLTYNRAIDESPCWSPAGNRICFCSDRSGSPQIYVMDADGLSAKCITVPQLHGNYNTSPSWSPKGDRIAYCSRRGTTMDICVMNVDGSDAMRLTNGPANNEDPSWSPDGSNIVFTSDRTGSPQIWVMTADGRNQYCLTSGSANHSPSWGPFMQ